MIKQNKLIINSHIRPLVKKDLLQGNTINQTAEKYGIRFDIVRKYWNSKAFSIIIIGGVTKRRCTNCMVHRELTEFHSNGDTKHSQCKACRNQICKNQYIIKKVKYGDKFRDKINAKFKKNYDKGFFNVKRCTKRRVKNILANNFRILGTK